MTPLFKRTKRAGSKRLAIHFTVHQTSDEDDFSQKMDTLVKVVRDPSTHVSANEDHQRQGQVASTPSPLTSLPRQRAMHQGAPAPLRDVADEVRRKVASTMRQVPADIM